MPIKISSISLLILLLTSPIYPQNKLNIAIAEFEGRNVSAMDAVTVSNLLRTEIVKSEKFNVVDRNNMEQILAEQAFQLTGCTTQECAVKMGKLLNVSKIIVGNVTKFGKIYIINTSMIDVETGRILRSEKVEANTLEELPRTTEYLAQILAGDKTITEQTIRKPPKLKEFNTLGIGLGYPYISLIWNLNKKFNIEPRFISDFNEVFIAGGRFNYNFINKTSISAFTGLGYNYLWFRVDEDFMSAAGFIAELFIGGIYKINKKINFTMDMGSAYIYITDDGYDVNAHGWEIVMNMGVQLYLF